MLQRLHNERHTSHVSPSAFSRLGSRTFLSFDRRQDTPHNAPTRFIVSVFAFHTPRWLAFLFRLEQGQYLIAHKAGEPFVTLLKAANGKVTRGTYNLQQVHSSVPGPPASGPAPWIPVDPAVVLPFHQKHGRVPCSFPVKPFIKVGDFLTPINTDQSIMIIFTD